MKTTFHKFLISFTIYALAIALLSSAIYIWVPAIPISHAYPYILLFIYMLTLVILSLLIKSMENKLNRFVNAFMLINFAKLILYTIIIFVYAYLNREDAVGFIAVFFVYYILFTAYEIVFLLRINK